MHKFFSWIFNLLKEKIGKTYDALVEDVTDDGTYFIARSYMDIPNEDGVIFIKNTPNNNIIIGEWTKCKITDILNYDLIGVVK